MLADIREMLWTASLPATIERCDLRACIEWLVNKTMSSNESMRSTRSSSTTSLNLINADHPTGYDSVDNTESSDSSEDEDTAVLKPISELELPGHSPCCVNPRQQHHTHDRSASSSAADKNTASAQRIEWEQERQRLCSVIESLVQAQQPEQGSEQPPEEPRQPDFAVDLHSQTQQLVSFLRHALDDALASHGAVAEVFKSQAFLLQYHDKRLPTSFVGFMQAQVELGQRASLGKRAAVVTSLGRILAFVLTFEARCSSAIQALDDARASDLADINSYVCGVRCVVCGECAVCVV